MRSQSAFRHRPENLLRRWLLLILRESGSSSRATGRTWIKNDPQEAAWAARQVYDAAEYAVLQPVDDKELTVYKPDVSEIGRAHV